MASSISRIERRQFIQTLVPPSITIPGCLRSGDRDGNSDIDSTVNKESADKNDHQRNSTDNESSRSDKTSISGPRFFAEHQVQNEAKIDPPLGLDVEVIEQEHRPAKIIIEITNNSTEAHTLVFSGFVPFPAPFGKHTDRRDQLVIVPGDDTPTPHANKYVTDQQRRSGHYFAPLAPVEQPDETTEIELAPEESMSGTHYILEVPESDDQRPWSDGPWPGEYNFQAPIYISSADKEATASFSLFVDYIE